MPSFVLPALGAACLATPGALAAALGAYNVDPSSVSVSGLSSGGFMSVQLGVAYSDSFPIGFGVFAGGPFDCARDQSYIECMYDQIPSIIEPTANMKAWSGNQIDPLGNLQDRQIYMEVGSADTVVGVNPMKQLQAQLANFDDSSKVTFVTTPGAEHTFPTDFNGSGDQPCDEAASPYISNCDYDGAGAVLKWMYGSGLAARNTGTLSGTIETFSQSGSFGAAGMDTTGYLYVPSSCQGGSTVCKLHVALHGCLQSHESIGTAYIDNTGYNMWADTNNIIVLYPQAVIDETIHLIWDFTYLSNPNGCWDWVGWYGNNADQIGGVQMVAIVNQVSQITSGYKG